MKTYGERTNAIIGKMAEKQAQQKKRKAWIAGIGGLCAVAVILAVLFVPYDTTPPDMSAHRNSPYYQVIQRLNAAMHKAPEYKNNFEYFGASLEEVLRYGIFGGLKAGSSAPEMDGVDMESSLSGTGNYQEVTDNQVAGVIEADLFKRTDKHIFYLQGVRNDVLVAYSIAQDASKEVGRYEINNDRQHDGWVHGTQMYLSADGNTATLILTGYGKVAGNAPTAYVQVISLDVSQPENIREKGQMFFTGSNISSRMVDGKLMLINRHYISNVDFEKEETFLPQMGTPGNMQVIAAEDIICPEKVNMLRYTVVAVLDENGLTNASSKAFLGYTDEVYVSRSNIYATQEYMKDCTMTDISWLSYGEELEYRGSVSVAGWVKDQYSMDEYEGILRVVTSTDDGGTGRNASLYCIDIESKKVVASVERFAPEGERAESVRFDGHMAYVCTAEVITLTDPVYFFDLSDLENITVKDTGTIDGYSSSLVNFGDGFLLGIGYGDNRQLKIEIYAETADGVESVSSFEMECDFSEDYKSYLIDRENRLVGLGVWSYKTGQTEYVLLGFDGVQMYKLQQIPLEGNVHQMRAALIDGWLYLLAEEFKVVPLV